MEVFTLTPHSFGSNCYVIISRDQSGENVAAVIDPSVEAFRITRLIDEKKARLSFIVLTHGHFDHILKLDALKCATGAEICIHESDAKMLTDPELNASEFFGLDFVSLGADRVLRDGEALPLGRESIEIVHTPGHTPGSVCFDCGSDLVCGDTLFTSGYGRYDLPGGDAKVLFSSLQKLADRRDNPIIHPGHGASCALADADVIRAIRHQNF